MGKKRYLLGILVIAFCFLLMSCGKLDEEAITFRASARESKDGSYSLFLKFKEDVKGAKISLVENDVELINQGTNGAKGSDLTFEFKEKSPGEYTYKLELTDEDGNEIVKDVSIKVVASSTSESEEESTGDNNAGTNDSGEDATNPPSETPVNPPEDNSNNSNNDSVIKLPTTWNGNGKQYNSGDVVIYNGKKYKCIQSHTSQVDWTPDSTAALWGEE